MKVYVKPEVRIEKFNLSKHIAACAYDMSSPTVKENCVAYGDTVGEEKFNTAGSTYFTESNINCTFNESNAQKYCYTPQDANWSIFNS